MSEPVNKKLSEFKPGEAFSDGPHFWVVTDQFFPGNATKKFACNPKTGQTRSISGDETRNVVNLEIKAAAI